MKITLTLKSVYGKTLAYPACEKAKLLAAMLRQRTFTGDNIAHFKALGFEIVPAGGLKLEDVQ